VGRLAPLLLTALLGCAAVSPLRAAEETGAERAREGAREATRTGTELVIRSLALLGVHYRFGGSSPDSGLDCSGLVRHVYEGALGLVLPRRSEEISRKGERVALDQLRPGDLVFFNTLRRAFSHVGIYIGENRFVHAPSRGGQVRIEQIDSRYWMRRFDGARRIGAPEAALAPLAHAVAREPAAVGEAPASPAREAAAPAGYPF